MGCYWNYYYALRLQIKQKPSLISSSFVVQTYDSYFSLYVACFPGKKNTAVLLLLFIVVFSLYIFNLWYLSFHRWCSPGAWKFCYYFPQILSRWFQSWYTVTFRLYPKLPALTQSEVCQALNYLFVFSGLNCAEAVNFAPADWLPYGAFGADLYQRYHKTPVLSHEELLCVVAQVCTCWIWCVYWSNSFFKSKKPRRSLICVHYDYWNAILLSFSFSIQYFVKEVSVFTISSRVVFEVCYIWVKTSKLNYSSPSVFACLSFWYMQKNDHDWSLQSVLHMCLCVCGRGNHMYL